MYTIINLSIKINLNQMVTESRNPASEQTEILSTLEMFTIINDEDNKMGLPAHLWNLHKQVVGLIAGGHQAIFFNPGSKTG